MKIRKVAKGVYHADFRTQEEMILATMRIDEHNYCDEKRFRKGPFTAEQFLAWHKSTHDYDYMKEVFGNCLTSKDFKDFWAGMFTDLSPMEQELVNYFQNVSKPFIVIVTFDNRTDDVEHEISHVLFKKFPTYRKQVIAIIKKYVIKKNLIDYIIDCGGVENKGVLRDEICAYLISNGAHDFEKFGIDLNDYAELINKLRPLFNKYFEKLRS